MMAAGLVLLHMTAAAYAAEIPFIEKIDPAYRDGAQTMMYQYTSDEAVRAAQEAFDALPPQLPEPETVLAPGAEPGLTVPLYVYRPEKIEQGPLPVVYYSHGGGYLLRRVLGARSGFQAMADRMGAIVITPKYRLSVEEPFPAALLDVYAGLQYVAAHGQELGMDTSRIILMGDSAGGGLSASLALYNRDHDNIPLKGQILIYPMLDYRTGTKDSVYHAPYTGVVCWTRESNAYAWERLRGGQTIDPEWMPYFSPSMAKDLSGLPPVMIYTGDLDLFVNEDLDYANRLIEAGVSTEVHVIPGLYHAFDSANKEAAPTAAFIKETTETAKDMFAHA